MHSKTISAHVNWPMWMQPFSPMTFRLLHMQTPDFFSSSKSVTINPDPVIKTRMSQACSDLANRLIGYFPITCWGFRRILASRAVLAGLGSAVLFLLPCEVPAQNSVSQLPSSGGHSPSPAKPFLAAGPSWSELTPEQQQALTPLSGQWASLSEFNKRKWLALSQNYRQLPPIEQARLHSRMNEWVQLSIQERTQARLNFAKTTQLSPGEKSDKWQAYQALTQEEKRELATRGPKAPVTAIAIRPVPPERLTTPPAKSTALSQAGAVRHRSRIASDPNQIDRHTLLPRSHPDR